MNENDCFFRKDPDMLSSAWERPWFENFEGYADKYTEAFKQLWERTRSDSTLQDSLVYPLLFIARHALELRLKSILWHLELQTNGAISLEKGSPLRSHSLAIIWNAIDALYIGPKSHQYSLVGKRISELNSYDAKSDTFRYPTHNDLSQTAHQEFLNINQFCTTFEKLNLFLEGIEAEVQME